MSPITKLVHAIAAAALMGLALPASSLAGAVTSTLIPCEKGNQCIVATFDAAPGEANDISVTTGPPSLSGTAYRLHDATAAVQDLADGCIAVDASTVSCSAYSLTVNTGDGNDRFTGPSERLEVNLGPGDDSGISGELNGGAGNEHLAGEMLNGGPGDDVLTASPGTEFSHLTGGPGADTMTGGGTIIASDIDFTRSGDPKPGAEVPAPDRIEGGPANSMLSYRDSRRPVVVDLAGGSGSAREDTIVNVQSVEGGSGDDVLRGDAKANLLFGADGNDRLAGRAGNDLLIGGAGRDSFAGGDGDDLVNAASTEPDVEPPFGALGNIETQRHDFAREPIGCGAGADTVVSVDSDLVDSSCELAREQGGSQYFTIDPFPRISRLGIASFRLPCPEDLRRGGRCSGSLTARDGSRRVAGARSKRKFRLRSSGATVRLRLPRDARSRVVRRKRLILRVAVTYKGADPYGDSVVVYRIKLPGGCKRPSRCTS